MIVLDTHVLVWWAGDDRSQLSKAALQAIERELAGGRVLLSSISAWEVAVLVRRGRLRLSMATSQWLSLIADISAVRWVPVDNQIAVAATDLPGDFHKDPADRFIVATARMSGASLVTADGKILNYGHVDCIW
ncbi:MAG TPA: type II toxin-antitoxin system VapC family toxin [Chloroflexota bacterium]|nr:type II toxin-antitoxin system VapC family toxin [Chloroflexota bacterium]